MAPLIKKPQQGLTLIELLTTVAIFSIIVSAFMSLYSSAFKAQQSNLESQYLLSNISYITEYMSRALRMAQKDIDGNCISKNHNYNSLNESHIKFLNYRDKCQEFFLYGETLKVKKLGTSHILTPSDLKVKNLKFKVLGESQEDDIQPRVIFTLKLASGSQTIAVQTAISQREMDIKR